MSTKIAPDVESFPETFLPELFLKCRTELLPVAVFCAIRSQEIREFNQHGGWQSTIGRASKLIETQARSSITGFASDALSASTALVWDALAAEPSPAIERNGITKPKPGWHSLRLSYASLLLSSGASRCVSMEPKRHSTPEVTLGTHVQTVGNERRRAGEKVALFLDGSR